MWSPKPHEVAATIIPFLHEGKLRQERCCSLPTVLVSKWQSQGSNPGKLPSTIIISMLNWPVFVSQALQATGTAALRFVTILYHSLQDDHAGITAPILMMEKLRFQEVK